MELEEKHVFACFSGILAFIVMFGISEGKSEISTEFYSSDALAQQMLASLNVGAPVAVVEGRIGDSALQNHNSTFEADLGLDTGAPFQTRQLVYKDGGTNHFSITVVGDTITFTVDPAAPMSMSSMAEANELWLRTRSVDGGFTWVDLTINGLSVPEVTAVGNDVEWMRISGIQTEELNIVGKFIFDWSRCDAPKYGAMAWQGKFYNVCIPEPSTWAMLIGATAILFCRRKVGLWKK